ncbi:hypothetical protein [Roseomonas chloroacetimidivorans]|uniref:hypothetical protein n=1 Tax=Roseomonas chloroacetimidivorans TaxID=1766656 RepID=UPI003C75FB0D
MTGSLDALFGRLEAVMAAVDERRKADAVTIARLEILTAMTVQLAADAPPEQARRARLVVEGYRMMAVTLPPDVGKPLGTEATAVLEALERAQKPIPATDEDVMPEQAEPGQGGNVVALRP